MPVMARDSLDSARRLQAMSGSFQQILVPSNGARLRQHDASGALAGGRGLGLTPMGLWEAPMEPDRQDQMAARKGEKLSHCFGGWRGGGLKTQAGPEGRKVDGGGGAYMLIQFASRSPKGINLKGHSKLTARRLGLSGLWGAQLACLQVRGPTKRFMSFSL